MQHHAENKIINASIFGGGEGDTLTGLCKACLVQSSCRIILRCLCQALLICGGEGWRAFKYTC